MDKPFIIEDIVKNNLCTGCGICVSESRSSEMIWSNDGFLVPKLDNSFNLNAVKVCPFNPSSNSLEEDDLAKLYLTESTEFDEKMGRYTNTYIGFSNAHRITSSSGGIATYIFEKLLQNKLVNNLFIVKELNGNYYYQWFSSVDQIKMISKTRYIPVTMEKLFSEIDNVEGSVAVSGVACFIKAIRLKQTYNPQYKEKIKFLVGIICGGLKSSFFTDFLAQKSGILGNYKNQEYRIKDSNSMASDYSFGAYDDDESFHQVKMVGLGDMWGTGLFKANACDFCTDVTTELADISLGDAWLPEYRKDGLGNSIIITRSKLAEFLINEGITNQDLSVKKVSKELIIQSQKSSFSHRQDAIKFRIKISKLKGVLFPKVRGRMLKSISIPYSLVQLQRLRTRGKSLKIWSEVKSANIFQKVIKKELFILRAVTKIYHKLK